MEKLATANEVKKYFGYDKVADFARDWKVLDEKEKDFFRVEVGKVIYS
jgi:hypothetical protein